MVGVVFSDVESTGTEILKTWFVQFADVRPTSDVKKSSKRRNKLWAGPHASNLREHSMVEHEPRTGPHANNLREHSTADTSPQ